MPTLTKSNLPILIIELAENPLIAYWQLPAVTIRLQP